MDQLTKRQQAILDFISLTMKSKGRPPTFREIGARFKIRSPNGVKYHLVVLERKGLIERDQHTARGIRVVHRKPRGPTLPLLGRVEAGPLAEAVELPAVFDLWELFGNPETLSVVRVMDDSLHSRHVARGDCLILRERVVVGLVRVMLPLGGERIPAENYGT